MNETIDHFHLLVDSVRDYAIFLLDASGHVVSWNAGAERIKGYRAAEIIGQHFSRFYTPEDIEKGTPALVLATAEAEGRCEHEGWRLRRDGTRFWGNVVVTALRGPDGRLLGYGKVTRDLTERRQAELDLLRSHTELRALTRRLEAVREEERARLARELHDELGQQLTALRMSAKWLEKHLTAGTEPDVLLAKLKDMLEIISTSIQTTRNVSADLRPTVLDMFGLQEAIEWLVADFRSKSDLEVGLTVSLNGALPDPDMNTTFFRIVQEALTNVVRHAQATRVDVALEQHDAALVCRIRDDGRGFSPQEVRPGALGLVGMRERAHLISGELKIESAPGQGSLVTLVVPILRTRTGAPSG
jgi:PAS domain S-box-containing protein